MKKKNYLMPLMLFFGFIFSDAVARPEIYTEIDALQLEDIDKQNENNKMNRELIRVKKQAKEDNQMLFAQEAKIQKLEAELDEKEQVIEKALNNPLCRVDVANSVQQQMQPTLKTSWPDE